MSSAPYTIDELMVTALSRLLKDGETVFTGIASPIAAAAVLLARRTHAPNLVYLNVAGGIDPKPQGLARSALDQKFIEGCTSVFNSAEIFDLSARGGLDTVFLSGIQIDRHGNLNLSVIDDYEHPKVRLPGGAGGALLFPTAKRTIVWRTKHDKRTFVEKVDFATMRGGVIDKIVTPLCVFSFQQGKIRLESVHPAVVVQIVVENTGFEFDSVPPVAKTKPPTEAELEILRNEIDPTNVRKIEFK